MNPKPSEFGNVGGNMGRVGNSPEPIRPPPPPNRGGGGGGGGGGVINSPVKGGGGGGGGGGWGVGGAGVGPGSQILPAPSPPPTRTVNPFCLVTWHPMTWRATYMSGRLPAKLSTRILNPGLLSYMASYEVACNIRSALRRG